MTYTPAIVSAYYRECGLPAPVFEYRFHPARKWRIDIAFPAQRIAIEVQGAIHAGGRHSRGAGIAGDMEKFNELARLGWSLILVQPKDVCMLDTVKLLQDTLSVKEESQPQKEEA